jgi:hypothetical protein
MRKERLFYVHDIRLTQCKTGDRHAVSPHSIRLLAVWVSSVQTKAAESKAPRKHG